MKVYYVFPSPAEGRKIILSVPDLTGNMPFRCIKENGPREFTGLAFFGTEEERPARLTLLEKPDADGSLGDLELLP